MTNLENIRKALGNAIDYLKGNNLQLVGEELQTELVNAQKQVENLAIHDVVKSLPSKETINTVANNHALQYAYINDSDYEDYVKAIEYGANYIKKHIEKQK